MVTYTVNVRMNEETRKFLQKQKYTLYLFKGIDAGGGAVSTVWQIISGEQLYNQAQNTITWEETYYIGEEMTTIANQASVSGTNPYKNSSNIMPVSLGKNYIYQGLEWKPDPTEAENTAFWIENSVNKVNNFYVSQKADSGSNGANDYIVVQEILGNGGTASFKPIQTIAMILSTSSVNKGAMITQAFSPGAIVTMAGETSSSVEYNLNNSWSGPSSQLSQLQNNDSIYESMLHHHSTSLMSLKGEDDLEKWAQVRTGTLKVNEAHSWTAKDNFTKLSFKWAGIAGHGKVSVKIGEESASSKSVPQANIAVNKKSGKITNNTDKTIEYTLQ